MKDKILNALKQEYAHLGLGDGILSGLAEMLAGTKLVTDENLQGIVAGQKAYLEDLQKSNDKRVQDAVTKTQNEANTKAESAKTEHAAAIAKVQKELDDYKAAHPEKQPVTPPAEDKNTSEWYKKEKAEREKREKEWQDKLDAIEKAKNESDKKLKDFEDAKTKEDAARAAAVEHFGIALLQVGIGGVYQLLVGVDEEHQHLGRHLIGAVGGVEQLRKMYLIGIARFMLDVVARAAHHHLLQHGVAHLLVDIIDVAGEVVGIQGAPLRHQALELLDPRSEGVGNVAHAVERAACGVLEEQQLVLDVFGRVIERGGREQEDTLAAADIAFVESGRLADALQQVVVAVAVVPEVVGLVDDDKIVIAWLTEVVGSVDYLVQTAVGDEVAVFVLDAEVGKGLHPVALHRRREDDEDTGAVAVGGDETLGNHGGHDGLAQAHHIGDEAATMLHHDIVALHDGVALVGEVVVVVGQLRYEVVLHLVAEVVDEHAHVEFVGRRLVLCGREVGLADDMGDIVQGYRDGIGPELLELLFAVVHIVVVLHGHIELVARRFGGAESLVAEVAAAHDDPAVAVFAMLLRQAEVELGMQVFGGVDAQLQASFGDVGAELVDALVDLGRVFGAIHVAEEVLAVLLQAGLLVAKEELAGCLRLTEEVVDIDADEDFDFLRGFQLPAQFEISRRTKIANHGMKYVEVGHSGGDAVELVHQRRIHVIEKLGAHCCPAL